LTEIDREIARSRCVMDQNWALAAEAFRRFSDRDLVVLARSLDPDRRLEGVSRREMGLVAYLAGLALKQIILDMATSGAADAGG
jgi:hypothetical protein